MELLNKIKLKAIRIAGKNINGFFSYWVRPKFCDDITRRVKEDKHSDVAIIISGKLVLKDHFTLETVKLYKRYYPDSPIIVSTWVDEDNNELEKIYRSGAIIVKSAVTDKIRSGYGSVNYQMTTAKAGIINAKELGCKYVMKTRSDQRIYESKTLSFLLKMMALFPLKIDADVLGRLIACSLSTFTNRLYNISDMLTFGYTADVLKYFSAPIDTRDPKEEELPADGIIEWSKKRRGEIWFCSNYLESLGFTLKWTKDDSDYYRKELFIIIDAESLDLYWPKYTDMEYRWRRYTPSDLDQCTFKKWLCMQ